MSNNNLIVEFAGINSRGNRCYITPGGNYIEQDGDSFYLLNQNPEYGFIGIEGEPDYKLDSSKITIIKENDKDPNENRSAFYGVRVGDIVDYCVPGMPDTNRVCEVIKYGFMNNNSVYIKDDEGNTIKAVAEWCKISLGLLRCL